MQKILLQLLLIISLCSAGIVFKKEKITVTIVACDTIEVQGIYYFSNDDSLPMSTIIDYPFPVDSVLGFPHFISVIHLANHQNLTFEKKNMWIIWDQFIPPRTTDSIEVTYRQKTLKHCGTYILSTTQNWNRPLEQADFKIITPANIILHYWSFQTDSVKMDDGCLEYNSFKKNFLPESDMLFEWICD